MPQERFKKENYLPRGESFLCKNDEKKKDSRPFL
jgi:hypothetical protein